MKKYAFIFIFSVIILIFNACSSSNKKSTEYHFLPSIKNATYTSYIFEDERGYDIKFELGHNSNTEPVAVVFNKIRQDITPGNKYKNTYKINVIATSSKIENLATQSSTLPNGVLFVINGTDYLKKVDFKKN